MFLRSSLFASAAFLLISQGQSFGFGLSLQADLLKTAANTPIASGSLFLLVASTNDNVFSISSNLMAGTSTTVGSFLSGDEMIVYRGSFSANGTINQPNINLEQSNPAYQGVFNQGDRLALVWFSGQQSSSTTLVATATFGFYDGGLASGPNVTDANSSGVDGSDAWVTPSNGTLGYQIGFYTTDGGALGAGTNPASAGRATGVVSVPEPSSFLLLGLAGAAVLSRRRRVVA